MKFCKPIRYFSSGILCKQSNEVVEKNKSEIFPLPCGADILQWSVTSSVQCLSPGTFPEFPLVHLRALSSCLGSCIERHRSELLVIHYHKIMIIYPYLFLVVINQFF